LNRSPDQQRLGAEEQEVSKARRRRRLEDAASFKGMGLAIVGLREERGLTQAALASKSDLATSSLRQIEHGQVDAHWGTLRRLASALDTPLEILTELAEDLAPGADLT
jgi:DNA-binding XRE family transcriptional regulator